MIDGGLIFAFSVGAVSSVNPCGFALLPAYFARRLSESTTGAPQQGGSLAVALRAGTAATAGFIFIFSIIGGIISLGAFWLSAYLPWAGLAIGVALVIIGLFVLAGKHIGINLPVHTSSASDGGVKGDFLFGLGYGTASLSCTLPIFLSVTAVAVTDGMIVSILSFVAFGLGMGTILMAIAVRLTAQSP